VPEINQLGKSQNFEWGSILWFVEPSNLDIERMSVGLITFYPGTTQEEHLHSADEQVIYVVSGGGTHIIDGQAFPLRPGDVKHISPYTRHTVINDSGGELKLIIVYTPSKFQRLLAAPAPAGLGEDGDIRSFLDIEVIGVLLNKLSEALGLSLAILDAAGEFIIRTDNYPRFCSLLCGASDGAHCRANIRKALGEITHAGQPHLFLCCNEIASIIIPILSGGAVKGYIKCGQVFLTKPGDQAARAIRQLAEACRLPAEEVLVAAAAIRLEPKSRLYAAAEATFAIANCVAEMTSTALRQKELDNSRLSLVKEQMASAKLEKALQEADFRLLQSQINPHFLFNTLNTIAQMAYIEGAEKAAGLVWSLSDLLRFSLRKTEELIPLHEEIKLLGNYLDIQQSRFGDRLRVTIDIEPGLENAAIPCMLLQPLVENAIIHGFELSTAKGLIAVAISRRGDRLACRIEDNGLGFDPRSAVAKKGGIGMSSVRNRLQYYFKDNYEFSIESRPGSGTVVALSFPAVGGSEDAVY
jgi:two-component system LytT family sensor kinase